jgi:hypothetical protein
MDGSDVSEHFRPSWSLISESRTSASSSSQVSMALPTCTHPVHSQPAYVHTLCTMSPRTCTHPIHSQPAYVRTLYTASLRTCTHPIHRQPTYASENRVFEFAVIPRISPSTLRATSDVCHFRCIHKYLQEALHKKIDIQYVQVCS